jgi:hypothetical protein
MTKAIFAWIAALLPAMGAQAATAAPSLCEASEVTVLTCELKGSQKLLSLCADAGFPAPDASLQYRFGPPGKPEFRFPEDRRDARKVFRYSATGYAGGGEAHIRFANGAYDYILFERTVQVEPAGKRKPQFSAGVVTRKAHKVLSVRTCAQGGALQVDVADHLSAEEFEYIDELP